MSSSASQSSSYYNYSQTTRRVRINPRSDAPPMPTPKIPMTHEEAIRGPHMKFENTQPAEPEKPKKD